MMLSRLSRYVAFHPDMGVSSSSTAIAVSRIHFPITALGPGSRIGIWLQGCSIRCEGCISMDTWNPGIGITTLSEVARHLAPMWSQATGITISGGEPFDQP